MFIIAQAFARHVRAGAYDAALASLRDALPSVTDPDAGTNYCYPEQVETWNAAAWRSTLEAVSKKTHEPIGTRDARVIGLVAGTGFGKTHALRIAPGLLRATHDVYVTYNMEQELAFDKAHARVAILMRVLMRALGASNLACAAGLEQLKGMEDQKDGLRKLLVHLFAHTSASNMHASTRHIFIGVDEVRLLGTDRVRESVSELSILVDALKNAGVRCTVVVSSLTEDVFHTSSGRGIERVSLPAVTSAVACEHVLAKLLPNAEGIQRAILRRLGGTHFRSMVFACRQMKESRETTLMGVALGMWERTALKLGQSHLAHIRDYVVQLGSKGRRASVPDALVEFLNNGVVPPVLVYFAFDKADGFEERKHPVQLMFDVSMIIDASKQLERSGDMYDRFRAQYGLSFRQTGRARRKMPVGFGRSSSTRPPAGLQPGGTGRRCSR